MPWGISWDPSPRLHLSTMWYIRKVKWGWLKCIITERRNKSEAPIVTSTMARFLIPVCRQKKIISIKASVEIVVRANKIKSWCGWIQKLFVFNPKFLLVLIPAVFCKQEICLLFQSLSSPFATLPNLQLNTFLLYIFMLNSSTVKSVHFVCISTPKQ